MKKSFDLGLLSDYRTELMGIAALMVILCHSLMPPSIDYHSSFLKWFLIQGNRGVDIFFFVSGFGLFISLDKHFRKEHKTGFYKKLGNWYKRRFSRILPAYLILGSLFFIFEGIHNNILDLPYIIGNLSTIQYWSTGKGIWYIAALLPLYLIAPFYFLLLKKTNKRLISTIAVILCLLLGVYFANWDGYKTFKVIEKFVSFIIGFYAADLIESHKKINIITAFAVIAVLFICIKLIFPKGTYYEWLFIYPIMLLSIYLFQIPFIYKASKWCGKKSLESYLSNCVLISLMTFVSLEWMPSWLLYGNYFRYGIIIVCGLLLAWITNIIVTFLRTKVQMTNPDTFAIYDNNSIKGLQVNKEDKNE